GLWRRHLYDKEVRAVVLVGRRADLDVVVAIGLGGNEVESSDRVRVVALRDAKGVVELRDKGVLEAGVVLRHPWRVGELVRVDEITEVCPAGMIEVGALGDARLDRPARLPRREG